MVVVSRKKSIALFITLGGGLTFVILLLYVGWVLLNWRSGALLFLGVLLVAMLITGVVLNTFFLVREIRRNEQHDAFINAVTHELKTPVASIRLYLETLQSRPVDEAKRNEFYSIMLDDSARLLQTIEQVLRTGRIGSSNRKPSLSRFDLSAVVDECVMRARALKQLPPESLTYQGSTLMVLAELDDVRAAISNLIDNAVKYSGNNVNVVVETAVVNNKYASVQVRDQGPGIPKTELKSIFKRFHRIPGATSRVPGTGLGLYIVRSVAKRHGGKAWAESEGAGRGSTFVLQFPIAR
ncbi:MAG TPA: HAMP domain-containing sensor histidine kinase [Bryobacteraceae bacterium]|jgi:signal transduction histidine kinase